MIQGLSHLATIRRSGNRPKSVMLTIDGQYFRPKFEQDFRHMELVVHDSVAFDDFRPFVGLTVTLCVGKWTPLATAAFEKLKEYAPCINVLCAEYGEDIGFIWTKKYGAVDFNDFRWLIQFHEAKNTICRTDKEVAERLRLEREAIENFPGAMNCHG